MGLGLVGKQAMMKNAPSRWDGQRQRTRMMRWGFFALAANASVRLRLPFYFLSTA